MLNLVFIIKRTLTYHIISFQKKVWRRQKQHPQQQDNDDKMKMNMKKKIAELGDNFAQAYMTTQFKRMRLATVVTTITVNLGETLFSIVYK